MTDDRETRARRVRAGARDHAVAGRTGHTDESNSPAQPCGNCNEPWEVLAGDIDAAEYSRLCHDDLGAPR